MTINTSHCPKCGRGTPYLPHPQLTGVPQGVWLLCPWTCFNAWKKLVEKRKGVGARTMDNDPDLAVLWDEFIEMKNPLDKGPR